MIKQIEKHDTSTMDEHTFPSIIIETSVEKQIEQLRDKEELMEINNQREVLKKRIKDLMQNKKDLELELKELKLLIDNINTICEKSMYAPRKELESIIVELELTIVSKLIKCKNLESTIKMLQSEKKYIATYAPDEEKIFKWMREARNFEWEDDKKNFKLEECTKLESHRQQNTENKDNNKQFDIMEYDTNELIQSLCR